MGDRLSPARGQSFFSVPGCLAVASLVCAITTEELLGYQAFLVNGVVLNSYVLMCSLQAVFAIALLAAGPIVRSIVNRPAALTGSAIAALLGSTLMGGGTGNVADSLVISGFALLSLASLALKIIDLEILASAPPWKLGALVFLAALIQSVFTPIFTLSTTTTWILAGCIGAIGVACAAGAHAILRKRNSDSTSNTTFVRPFTPSASVIIGIGIIGAGISFLNPLMLYDSISLNGFLLLTFSTHFAAALLFGVLALANRDSSHAVAFKGVSSLVLISFFLLALLGSASSVPRAVCTSTFSLFELVTFLAIANLASYSSTNRLRLFGGYYALMRCCELAGITLGAEDVMIAPLGHDASLFGSLLAIACVIAAVWLLTESHLNRFFWGNPSTEIVRARSTSLAAEASALTSARDDTAVGPTASESNSNPTAEIDLASIIERSVHRLADEAALTPRERDVFELMAQGRSATFIGEELFVSTNTVRKHIAHVYEKLQVHSKQELLTLVQQESTRIA